MARGSAPATEKKMSKDLPALFLLVTLFPASCTLGNPPDDLFRQDVEKMSLIDRELGFTEEISGVRIVRRVAHGDRVEVEVRVSGWATHPDLTIGATLPASAERRPGWATWRYFCRKEGKTWKIEEKYKVEEGFDG